MTSSNGVPRRPTAAPGGLEDVVVADTEICFIDGIKGRLVVRGHDVAELATTQTFERMCGLLWDGDLVAGEDEEALRCALGEAREEAFARVADMRTALQGPNGMDALRAALAQLEPCSDETQTRYLLTAATAVFAAAWLRYRDGADPIPPDKELLHAADYLRMTGRPCHDVEKVAALDAYLVTMAEHDLMPSTFAVRVIVSTGSDPVSAVVAGVGALKGPAHGGAPAPVLDMIEEIGSLGRVGPWVHARISAGRRIMGMGHRVYRTRDPRAAILEAVIRSGVASERSDRLVAIARAIECVAEDELKKRQSSKVIRANVELYAAVLLDVVGLPREAFTPTYAVACVAGWLAHAKEQAASGRLLRPLSRYVGPLEVP